MRKCRALHRPYHFFLQERQLIAICTTPSFKTYQLTSALTTHTCTGLFFCPTHLSARWLPHPSSAGSAAEGYICLSKEQVPKTRDRLTADVAFIFVSNNKHPSGMCQIVTNLFNCPAFRPMSHQVSDLLETSSVARTLIQCFRRQGLP